MKPTDKSNVYVLALIYAVFCLLATSLFGCDKISIPPDVNRPTHVEVHIQVIDALVILEVDGPEVTIDGRGTHLVKALRYPSVRCVRVVLVYGKKATIAIHDYSRGSLYEPGEIKGGESFGI